MLNHVCLCALALPAVASIAAAQVPDARGIPLNPGERLTAVNGTPVASPGAAPATPPPVTAGTCRSPRSGPTFTPGAVTLAGGTVPASGNGVIPGAFTRPAAPPNTVPSTRRTVPMGGGDQQRAQAEANHMARHGVRGHVGGTIGAFEGVGWAGSGTPSTCTPGRPMRLTADAIARGPGGVYRVRAWR